jgi:hypothetical protein
MENPLSFYPPTQNIPHADRYFLRWIYPFRGFFFFGVFIKTFFFICISVLVSNSFDGFVVKAKIKQPMDIIGVMLMFHHL